MTELNEFEGELRAALSDVQAAAAEPDGLADRLVDAAMSGTSRPHRASPDRSRRWLSPVLTAAAVIAVVLAVVAVVSSSRAPRVTPATPHPGLTKPLIAPKSLTDVREPSFHVEPGQGFAPDPSWELAPDFQGIAVGWADQEIVIRLYY